MQSLETYKTVSSPQAQSPEISREHCPYLRDVSRPRPCLVSRRLVPRPNTLHQGMLGMQNSMHDLGTVSLRGTYSFDPNIELVSYFLCCALGLSGNWDVYETHTR